MSMQKETTTAPGREAPTQTKAPDPEVTAKAKRRRFTAAYKMKILREVEERRAAGREIGSILRREGLYSSAIGEWEAARERSELEGLEPQKRGPKPDPDREMRAENERLRRENERLQKKLEQAELVIGVQKKLSRLLGLDVKGD